MTPSTWRQIRFAARLDPEAPAVLDPSGPIPYRMLTRDVDALATELLERGLTPDDMVGLHLGFSYQHVLMTLALDRLGVPSACFAVGSGGAALPVVEPAHGVTLMVSGQPAPAAPPCRWLTVADHQRPKLGSADAARLDARDEGPLDGPPDGLVRVLWSSGTTGGAKGTPLTRALLSRRLALRRLQHHLGPRTRAFTGMPFSTPPGYLMVLGTLCAGGTVVLPNPSIDFVSLANLVGVTAASATPAMLVGLVGRPDAPPRRLRTVESLEVAGANLPASLARHVRDRLTANLWIDYGTSETGRIAGADAALAIADSTAAGFVIPWIEAEIVDADDRPLPAGAEGRLRVRGPQVIAGYFRDPAATQRNFRDGWFHPGDVGTIDANRLLRITGRIEDVIVRDGVTLSPIPLEEAIRALTGVRDVAVFPLPDPHGAIGAALVLEPGSDPRAVQAAAAAQLGDRAPVRVLLLDRLPRNENGKLMRRELVALALRG